MHHPSQNLPFKGKHHPELNHPTLVLPVYGFQISGIMWLILYSVASFLHHYDCNILPHVATVLLLIFH